MQSIFRLPWCTDQPSPKMSDKFALEKMRASPVVEMPIFNRLKRRRSESAEPHSHSPARTLPNKKRRVDGCGAQQRHEAASSTRQPSPSSEREHASPQPTCEDRAPPRIITSGAFAASDRAHAQSHAKVALPQHVPETSHSEAAMDSAMGMSIAAADVHMDDLQGAVSEDVAELTSLQQVIDNEISMQILMKHNELRLIEQELAKCQIALEQLRRCEVCPFPGDTEPSMAISAGLGISLEPLDDHTRPPHPAPYGVTDGPYTRHYAQWLLPGPDFDPMPAHTLHADSGAQAAARATRNHGHIGHARKSTSKSVSLPGRSADMLQSLPNYPAAGFKDKSAPLILRRSTDGQLVKLICNNCHRGNFSSIQGFLNHCRIAHKVDYKSHDAAAIDCGQPLNQQEAASLPPEAQSAVSQKPSTSRASSTVTTPFKSQVHPMNSINVLSSTASPLTQTVPKRKAAPALSNITPGRTVQASPLPLKPSSIAPHLSARFAKYSLGGNLEQAIASAKQKIDFGNEAETLSPEGVDPLSPSLPVTGARTVAGASRPNDQPMLGSAPRPPSRKAYREPAQRHRPPPLTSASTNHRLSLAPDRGEIPESPQDHSPNLSPHTADSNPGLVSDHEEDDEHNSGSEDEAPHDTIAHSLPVRRSCADNMEIDVTIDDDMDEHGVVIRRNSMMMGGERGLSTSSSSSGAQLMGKRGV